MKKQEQIFEMSANIIKILLEAIVRKGRLKKDA